MVLIGIRNFGEIAIKLTRSGVEEEELPIRTLDNREQNAIGTCSSDYVRKRKTKKDKDYYLSGSGLGKKEILSN